MASAAEHTVPLDGDLLILLELANGGRPAALIYQELLALADHSEDCCG